MCLICVISVIMAGFCMLPSSHRLAYLLLDLKTRLPMAWGLAFESFLDVHPRHHKWFRNHIYILHICMVKYEVFTLLIPESYIPGVSQLYISVVRMWLVSFIPFGNLQ